MLKILKWDIVNFFNTLMFKNYYILNMSFIFIFFTFYIKIIIIVYFLKI